MEDHLIEMPVGKHKGTLVVDLPSGYLSYVAANWDDDRIATIADKEYRRRTDENDHRYD